MTETTLDDLKTDEIKAEQAAFDAALEAYEKLRASKPPGSRGGRAPVPKEKHFKRIHLSISPAAYRRYIQIPKNERSKRISRFLERVNVELDVREAGERLD